MGGKDSSSCATVTSTMIFEQMSEEDEKKNAPSISEFKIFFSSSGPENPQSIVCAPCSSESVSIFSGAHINEPVKGSTNKQRKR